MLPGMTTTRPNAHLTPLQIVQVTECCAAMIRGCRTVRGIARHTHYSADEVRFALFELARRGIAYPHQHRTDWWLLTKPVAVRTQLAIRTMRVWRHLTGTADSVLEPRRARAAASVDEITAMRARRDAA